MEKPKATSPYGTFPTFPATYRGSPVRTGLDSSRSFASRNTKETGMPKGFCVSLAKSSIFARVSASMGRPS